MSSFYIPIHQRDGRVVTSSSSTRKGRAQSRQFNGLLRRSSRIFRKRNNRSSDRTKDRVVQRVSFQRHNDHSYSIREPDGSIQSITVYDPALNHRLDRQEGGVAEVGGVMLPASAVAAGTSIDGSIDMATLYATAIDGARNLEATISSRIETSALFNCQTEQEVRSDILFDEDVPPPPTPPSPQQSDGGSDWGTCLYCPEDILDDNDDRDHERDSESDSHLVGAKKKRKGKRNDKMKCKGKGKGKGKSTRSSSSQSIRKSQENDIDYTNNEHSYHYVEIPLPGPSNGRPAESRTIPSSYKVVEEECDIGLGGPVYKVTSYTELGDFAFSNTQYFNKARLSTQLKKLNEVMDQCTEKSACTTFREYLPHDGETQAEQLLRLEYTRLNNLHCVLQDEMIKIKADLLLQRGSRQAYERMYQMEKTKVINRDRALKRRTDVIKRRDNSIKELKKDIKTLKETNQDNEETMEGLRHDLRNAETALVEFNCTLNEKLDKIEDIEEKLNVATEKLEVVKDKATPVRELEVNCADLRNMLKEKENAIANFRACTICKRPYCKITAALTPCGHLTGCDDCLRDHFQVYKIETCPVCRKKVDGLLNVYWA